MRRLKSYRHRVFDTPSGPRLMGLARGRMLVPGPEEHVRQDVLRALVEEYGYPRAALVAEEPVARGTDDRTRADIIVLLPAEGPGRARLGDAEPPLNAEGVASYREVVEELRRRLDPEGRAIEFVDVPPEVSLGVDGREVACRIVGFYVGDLQIGLLLDPGASSREALARVKSPLVVPVYGYGVEPEEWALAKQLGLPEYQASPTTMGSDEVAREVDDFLFIEGDDLWVRGALADDELAGWVVLTGPHGVGVLARIDVQSAAWRDLRLDSQETALRIPLPDGRAAWREDLEALSCGEVVAVHVVPERADGVGEVFEGVVVGWDDGWVAVDCGDAGELRASLTQTPDDDPWLMGRLRESGPALAAEPAEPLDGELRPFAVVECKARAVALSEEVVAQGLGYARTLNAQFLVTTNCHHARTFLLKPEGVEPVDDLPDYGTATSGDDYLVRPLPPSKPRTSRYRRTLQTDPMCSGYTLEHDSSSVPTRHVHRG